MLNGTANIDGSTSLHCLAYQAIRDSVSRCGPVHRTIDARCEHCISRRDVPRCVRERSLRVIRSAGSSCLRPRN